MIQRPTTRFNGPSIQFVWAQSYNEKVIGTSFSRIVVKLGTKVVTGAFGNVERGRLSPIVRALCEKRDQGSEVLLVSSGAVGLGRKVFDQHTRRDLPFRQACAAVGQNLLMTTYQKLFATYGYSVAQVLVTAEDLANRHRYLNLRAMLGELLQLGVIPIINENDSVSTMELFEEKQEKVFGDNDKLSALVASKLEADLLVLLTDVDGIYDCNPQVNATAKKIECISGLEELDKVCAKGISSTGRGGLESKLEAIRLASMSGVASVVGSGLKEEAIDEILSGNVKHATYIEPTNNMTARQKWIGFSAGVAGVVSVNRGARKALVGSSASLLPVGIESVSGDFKAGSTVSIECDQVELGRGITNYSSVEIEKVRGLQSEDVKTKTQAKLPEEVIHRDRLVILTERAE